MSTMTPLRTHAWIAELACADADGVLLRPSDEGIAALHQLGRAAWIAQLGAALDLTAPPARWRLADAPLSALTPAQCSVMLRADRPLLPHVLEETRDADGSLQLRLRVPLELAHFDGHFPAAPVLPGVLQLGWALALAAPRLGTAAKCREFEALKFQQLLRPGDDVLLHLRWDTARGKLHFAYRLGEQAYSSGRLLLEHAHG
jgi:3-hydroxymyristoyl/3-hydroxydecanoyl-(acyl carrier protein) dehydratase